MRFIVQFMDKTTKRISEKEAKAVMEALNKKKPIMLRGAFIQPHFITIVKPISKNWFQEEYVEQQLSLSQNDNEVQLLQ